MSQKNREGRAKAVEINKPKGFQTHRRCRTYRNTAKGKREKEKFGWGDHKRNKWRHESIKVPSAKGTGARK